MAGGKKRGRKTGEGGNGGNEPQPPGKRVKTGGAPQVVVDYLMERRGWVPFTVLGLRLKQSGTPFAGSLKSLLGRIQGVELRHVGNNWSCRWVDSAGPAQGKGLSDTEAPIPATDSDAEADTADKEQQQDHVLTFDAEGRPHYSLVDDDDAPPFGDDAEGDVDDGDGEELDSLLSALPPTLKAAVREACTAEGRWDLAELVLDTGRPYFELRFENDRFVRLPLPDAAHAAHAVTPAAVLTRAAARRAQRKGQAPAPVPQPHSVDTVLAYLRDFMPRGVERLSKSNRMGLDGTLHRISVIRDETSTPVGLTCRVGRVVSSCAPLIVDVLASLAPTTAEFLRSHSARGAAAAAPHAPPALRPPNKSLLLLGPPGVGKTALLRETARVLADELDLRVIIVDTSCEIAGGGGEPHPAVGHARVMRIPPGRQQADVMLEAVQNNNPQVIVVDEVSTPAEVAACRSIAQRGVTLIATAHGTTLSSVLRNPQLVPLLGNVQAVILGDDAKARRHPGATEPGAVDLPGKTQLERAGAPTFDYVAELQSRTSLRLHPSSARAVDNLLDGKPAGAVLRWQLGAGRRTHGGRLFGAGASLGPMRARFEATSSRRKAVNPGPVLGDARKKQRAAETGPRAPPRRAAEASPRPAQTATRGRFVVSLGDGAASDRDRLALFDCALSFGMLPLGDRGPCTRACAADDDGREAVQSRDALISLLSLARDEQQAPSLGLDWSIGRLGWTGLAAVVLSCGRYTVVIRPCESHHESDWIDVLRRAVNEWAVIVVGRGRQELDDFAMRLRLKPSDLARVERMDDALQQVGHGNPDRALAELMRCRPFLSLPVSDGTLSHGRLSYNQMEGLAYGAWRNHVLHEALRRGWQ